MNNRKKYSKFKVAKRRRVRRQESAKRAEKEGGTKMARFWMTAVFMVFSFIAGCGKNGVSTGADAETDDTDNDVRADMDAGTNANTDTDAVEDDNDGTDEDVFQTDYPDIAGAWTIVCHSDLIAEVNFNLNFFFFQDGTFVRGVEGGSEDAYFHGVVLGDGQISLTMEEPCTGSTVTFTGVVTDHTFISGRYSWEWNDAYGVPHHDEGVWHASPSPNHCPPCPDIAGDWTLTYENGHVESAVITVEQVNNTFRGQSLDGCEYLGALSLTPECSDLRIYRRCPDLAGQTRVLFGILRDTGQMSGSWYDMNDTFGCPEIKGGSWESSRP